MLRVNHGLTQRALVPPLEVLTSALSRSFGCKRQDILNRKPPQGGFLFTMFPDRVPGLGQITWQIVPTKKIRGHSGEKNSQKSRNSCGLNGGGVAAHGQLTQGTNGPSPGTNYKRSKNVCSGTFGQDCWSFLRSL